MKRAVVLVGGALVIALALVLALRRGPPPPIRLGVLQSLSGAMAISGKPVAEATLMAIEELNAAGGVLGRPLEAVLRDGASDPATFAREAERLITTDGVAATFCCWTSSGRRQVTPVIEARKHLLFYPVQYEGLESSPFTVYTGAAPNQSIVPAVTWALDTLGRRIFLVGSDYVFSHTVNAIIRDVTGAMGGEVVGEAYAPLGSRDFAAVVASIGRSRPDLILNTISGDANAAFFRALRQAGLTPETMPTVSFGFAEPLIAAMGVTDLVGDYGAWSYFQSIDSPENKRFVEGMRRRLGPNAAVSDPMEAAYVSVHLWARAVQDAGTTESAAVLAAIADQSFAAPQGVVYVDAATHHTWKAARIGRIRADGQFDIVWESGRPVRPTPFPAYRSRAEWDDFLHELFTRWGGRWLNEEVGTSGGGR